MNRFDYANRLNERMMLACGGEIYPACTRMRLSNRSTDPVRHQKASEVWNLAIKRLAAGADPEAVAFALADGVTLGPHGVPWR